MAVDLKALKNKIHTIAKEFVEENYPKEAAFFAAFWEPFALKMDEWKGVAPKNWLVAESTRKAAAELGFADVKSLDLITPIVLCTIAKLLGKTKDEKLSVSELATIVEELAVSCGASGQLLARLIRYLPELYVQLLTAKPKAKEAFISIAKKPQYKVWAEGKPPRILDDIGKYEKNRDNYLFWVDVTNDDCQSFGKSHSLLPTARRLLLVLVENVGISIPRSEIYQKLIGINPEGVENWRNLLSQYFGQLEKFTEGNFRRDYLVDDPLSDSLSVKKSFNDKYFVFRTLRAAKD